MKIDTSTIEGFDKMTDAEKVAALTGYEIPEKADDGKTVSKAQFDKTASELAAAKKALREKQTDDEKAAADRAEAEAAAKAEMDALRERAEKAETALKVAEYKAAYMGQGYDEALAKETAEALAAGKTDVVLANGKKHAESMTAKIKAELMDKDRQPSGGGKQDGDGPDVAFAKSLKTGSDSEAREKVLSKWE